MNGERVRLKRLMIPEFKSGWQVYLLAGMIIFTVAGICYIFTDYIGYLTVSFILLFVVSILSVFMGIGPIALAAMLSAFVWDFFFIPPKFTITIDKTNDALMLAMFFIIALVNGILTARVRRQEKLALDRESRTNALYQLTRNLSDAGCMEDIKNISAANISSVFGFEAILLIQDGNNKLNYPDFFSADDRGIAMSVYKSGEKAGKFSGKPGLSDFTFYPLPGRSMKTGVVAVRQFSDFSGEELEFWEAMVTQISNAAEREFLNDLARKARFLDESDKLYKTLFNSISHELRIPVATILSGSESLLESSEPGISKELSYEIFKASNRLNRLIENLLNMSRLESGHITPRPDWCDIHDLVNKVTDNLADELKAFTLKTDISDDMPFVFIDFGLTEQIVHNLLYNAIQYASPSKEIGISVTYDGEAMVFSVTDRGPGFPEEEIINLFRKFYRIEGTATGGTGLGLSIVKGFTEAQKGTVSASNRKGGGAIFTFRIPSEMPRVEYIDKQLQR